MKAIADRDKNVGHVIFRNFKGSPTSEGFFQPSSGVTKGWYGCRDIGKRTGTRGSKSGSTLKWNRGWIRKKKCERKCILGAETHWLLVCHDMLVVESVERKARVEERRVYIKIGGKWLWFLYRRRSEGRVLHTHPHTALRALLCADWLVDWVSFALFCHKLLSLNELRWYRSTAANSQTHTARVSVSEPRHRCPSSHQITCASFSTSEVIHHHHQVVNTLFYSYSLCLIIPALSTFVFVWLYYIIRFLPGLSREGPLPGVLHSPVLVNKPFNLSPESFLSHKSNNHQSLISTTEKGMKRGRDGGMKMKQGLTFLLYSSISGSVCCDGHLYTSLICVRLPSSAIRYLATSNSVPLFPLSLWYASIVLGNWGPCLVPGNRRSRLFSSVNSRRYSYCVLATISLWERNIFCSFCLKKL